ncbi:acyl carrier protein [Streptomyces marincola]|uniref:acyl carrier protein n=1 Tax=Streptomyces marincola TaxID=2878388 RepID=UPI001CF124F8|nr:acyl carrier protein [Streptomyces marincola]UCM90392.1 acyl carrier protein [Streptomyces marincola]
MAALSFGDLKAALVSMGVPAEDVTEHTVREEAGLDSLGVADLAAILRERHGLVVGEERLLAAVTLGDLCRAIAAQDAVAAQGPHGDKESGQSQEFQRVEESREAAPGGLTAFGGAGEADGAGMVCAGGVCGVPAAPGAGGGLAAFPGPGADAAPGGRDGAGAAPAGA